MGVGGVDMLVGEMVVGQGHMHSWIWGDMQLGYSIGVGGVGMLVGGMVVGQGHMHSWIWG